MASREPLSNYEDANMLWNVFVFAHGRCMQINSTPYDSEQVALAIDSIDDVATFMLMRYDGNREASDEGETLLDQSAESVT